MNQDVGDVSVNSQDESECRTPVAGDPHHALRFWLRMLSCTTHIEKEINRRFRANFGISLARFDYLAQLQRHPQGLRMNELTRFLMVTSGNITGLTDELVRDQYVERLPDPSDRRAARLRLTASGESIFHAMAAAHERWILELMQGMEDSDILSASASLGKLRSMLGL